MRCDAIGGEVEKHAGGDRLAAFFGPKKEPRPPEQEQLCHAPVTLSSESIRLVPFAMRLAHRLLMATPASIGSKSSLTEALALLPPLQLYRRLLRVHRKLDPEMRVLGDSYVKKEFRAHRTAENPLHIVRFNTGLAG